MSNYGPIASGPVKSRVINMCWDYLNENFHKFKDENKIKVVLGICTKNMPTVIEGEMNTKVVMPEVKVEDKLLENSLGSDSPRNP